MRSPVVADGAQRVLVVPRELVQSLYDRPQLHTASKTLDSVLEAVRTYGRFVRRDWAEAHTNVKQIVACAVVRNGARLLCVRRSSKSDRRALRLRYTLLFGGHVDDFDARAGAPVLSCLRRELLEELGVEMVAEPRLLGVVADSLTEVGELHLGMVFDVALDERLLFVGSERDKAEFVHARKNSVHELEGWSQIIKIADSLDPWSKLLLESSIGQQLLEPSGPYSQPPLPLEVKRPTGSFNEARRPTPGPRHDR
jgi:predicted NUDIX family phosphoesterase